MEAAKVKTHFLYLLASITLGLAGAPGCGMTSTYQNRQGVALQRQGNQQAAMERFQQALANNPRNSDAVYNLATVMHQQGVQTRNEQYLSQAEMLYNQCLDIDRDHPECHRGLAVLLAETQRSDKAFKLLKNWAISSPHVPAARVELARLYEEFGDANSAAIHLQDALQLDHRNERAWTALASLRERSGDYQQALSNYQRAYALSSRPELAQRIASLNNRLASNPDLGSSGAVTGGSVGGQEGWRTRY